MENKSSTCHMTNEKRLIDANAMKHQLECRIATVIYRGVDNIPMGKDSSSAFEYLRGYERGAVETANIALGQKPVDAVEVPDKELLKAINLLIKQYEHSKNSDYVHHPVAHAFFHTWEQLDGWRK